MGCCLGKFFASSKAIATPSSRSGGVSPHRTHHSAFAKLPPDGSPLPSRHHADSPSDEVADVEGALSPEAVRFASYYGDADELRARNFQRGVIKFNADPKAGIAYLEKQGLLRHDADAHAAFLRGHSDDFKRAQGQEPLSPRAVGDYLGGLGGRDEVARAFHRALLAAYARSTSNISGATLVGALRTFLSGFRLPGEAQSIDRIMAAFADAFVRENPTSFASPDVVYVLSFAAVMLNTDLHKGGIKKKMTRAQFVLNFTGAAAARDVTEAVLIGIYNDIAAAPLALDISGGVGGGDGVSTFFAPARSGWLHKRCSGGVSRWKRRFFLLSHGVLYYFSAKEDVARGSPRCIVPLDETMCERVGALGLKIVPRPVASKSSLSSASSGDNASDSEKAVFSSPVRSRSSKGASAGLLKTAKRAADGSVRQSRGYEFEMLAADAEDRELWAMALSAHASRGGGFIAPNTAGIAERSAKKEVKQIAEIGALPSAPSIAAIGSSLSAAAEKNSIAATSAASTASTFTAAPVTQAPAAVAAAAAAAATTASSSVSATASAVQSIVTAGAAAPPASSSKGEVPTLAASPVIRRSSQLRPGISSENLLGRSAAPITGAREGYDEEVLARGSVSKASGSRDRSRDRSDDSSYDGENATSADDGAFDELGIEVAIPFDERLSGLGLWLRSPLFSHASHVPIVIGSSKDDVVSSDDDDSSASRTNRSASRSSFASRSSSNKRGAAQATLMSHNDEISESPSDKDSPPRARPREGSSWGLLSSEDDPPAERSNFSNFSSAAKSGTGKKQVRAQPATTSAMNSVGRSVSSVKRVMSPQRPAPAAAKAGVTSPDGTKFIVDMKNGRW